MVTCVTNWSGHMNAPKTGPNLYKTSKTEVLQMPSAIEVNLFQGVFDFIYKFEFSKIFEFYLKIQI